MEKETVNNLSQVIKSLEEATDMLENSYNKGDPEKFNQSKKLILNIQNKIDEIVG